MNKINFNNSPSTATPINATNMNQLQTNVDDAKVEKCTTLGNTDLNNIKDTVFYYCLGTCSNKPENRNGWLTSIKYTNDYVLQLYYTVAYNKSFQRVLNSGTWGEWKEVMVETSGSWTPTLNTVEGAAPTYTTITGGVKGTYKKIGNMVFISFFLRGSITALNGTNNYALIKGLPFTPRTMNVGENAITVGVCYNCLTTDNPVWFNIYDNAIRIQGSRGSSSTVWKVTPSGGYFIIAGSGWYETE